MSSGHAPAGISILAIAAAAATSPRRAIMDVSLTNCCAMDALICCLWGNESFLQFAAIFFLRRTPQSCLDAASDDPLSPDAKSRIPVLPLVSSFKADSDAFLLTLSGTRQPNKSVCRRLMLGESIAMADELS